MLNFVKLSASRFLYNSFDSQGIIKEDIEPGVRKIWKTMAKLPPKSYSFYKKTLISQDSSNRNLNPPSGSNLFEVIQTNPRLRKEIAQMFERYGQKLQLRMDERRLEIIKDQDGVIYSYPLYDCSAFRREAAREGNGVTPYP